MHVWWSSWARVPRLSNLKQDKCNGYLLNVMVVLNFVDRGRCRCERSLGGARSSLVRARQSLVLADRYFGHGLDFSELVATFGGSPSPRPRSSTRRR